MHFCVYKSLRCGVPGPHGEAFHNLFRLKRDGAALCGPLPLVLSHLRLPPQCSSLQV